MSAAVSSRTRDLARERQARKRLRDAARRAIRAEAEARRLEAAQDAAEALAPLAMREAAHAPSGALLHGPRVVVIDGRAVRGLPHVSEDPLARIRLTGSQARAARMLRLDYDEVGAGIGPSAVDWSSGGGNAGPGAGSGAHAALVRQLETRARLEGALTHAGAFTPCLRRVVCDCVPVCVWAREVGKSQDDAMAWLRAGLDRLTGFYFVTAPERPRSRALVGFGPERESYEVGGE